MRQCSVCKNAHERIVPLSNTSDTPVCELCANELLDFFEDCVVAVREATVRAYRKLMNNDNAYLWSRTFQLPAFDVRWSTRAHQGAVLAQCGVSAKFGPNNLFKMGMSGCDCSYSNKDEKCYRCGELGCKHEIMLVHEDKRYCSDCCYTLRRAFTSVMKYGQIPAL